MKKILTGIMTFCGAAMLQAAPPVESLGDLRDMQEKITKVVREKTPATVSLVSMRNGSSGSGVIVSEDGLILTAAHVIQGSKKMTVVFPNGKQAEAKVLGANYSRDAAMAKLVGDGPWPFADVAPSDTMKVGDFVVAMGHPKGYDPTRRPPVRFGRIMTTGALGFVTTDCTLIGGDSGGPLFDLEGRVVGIHSHIASERNVNNHAGISGFLNGWDKMLLGKTWGVLGGSARDPNRAVMGLTLEMNEADNGLVIGAISAGGPASAAGFEAGDLVTKINGREINDLVELTDAFVDFLPGEEINVTFFREGEEISKAVKLGRLADLF